jgi:ketosteroid isomerase-like protein
MARRCSRPQAVRAPQPLRVFSAASPAATRCGRFRWLAAIAICVGALGVAQPTWSQGARTPTDTVDAFHAALKKNDTAAALSLLDRGLVVFEFGTVDPTVEAYAFQHLPFDIDVAAVSTWNIESRRVGGEGDERWVLTTYHVTGRQANGSPIDQTTLETMILRRTSGLFRIVHMHWSTNDATFQALSKSRAAQPGASPAK